MNKICKGKNVIFTLGRKPIAGFNPTTCSEIPVDEHKDWEDVIPKYIEITLEFIPSKEHEHLFEPKESDDE